MKFTLLYLFLSLFSSALYGQSKLLTLDHSCKNKLPNTSSLSVIDNRLDNQILGYVETGISDKVTAIKFEGNLPDSISVFFKNIRSYPELIMMLNEFHIWEFRDREEKFGRFKISLRFFQPIENNKYVEVMAYDSIHSVYGQIDITNRLMKSISKNLCRIASDIDKVKNSNHLSHKPLYTRMELTVIDSLEKSVIPIYQTNKPQAGIYAKYTDFKTNTPSEKIELIIDEYNPKNVKAYYLDKKGKKKYITSKNIYAISDGTRVFKSLSMGFFEMVKEKEDFYFVRPTTTGQSVGYIYSPMGAGIIGGVVGSLISSYGNNRKGQLLLYKVNHRFGGGIPISKVYK
jgi:hypothetical protein